MDGIGDITLGGDVGGQGSVSCGAGASASASANLGAGANFTGAGANFGVGAGAGMCKDGDIKGARHSKDLAFQSIKGFSLSRKGIPRIMDCTPRGATKKVSCNEISEIE